jgi:hypothetical protein
MGMPDAGRRAARADMRRSLATETSGDVCVSACPCHILRQMHGRELLGRGTRLLVDVYVRACAIVHNDEPP